MIIIIIMIVTLILGILLCYLGEKDYWSEWKTFVGIFNLVISIILILVVSVLLISKPIDYKKFKAKYESIKETMTKTNDVRDATYTIKIIEVNEEIRNCRMMINSKWVGIFYNKRICDMELLTKGSDEE